MNVAFIKYREVIKHFNFSKVIDIDKLPRYVTDYVSDDETILLAYKTRNDFGLFTDKCVILFDNSTMFGIKKNILTISYHSFQTATISYLAKLVEFNIFLDNAYPLKLKFNNISAREKTRVRRLYSCIKRAMNHQEIRLQDIECLSNEAISKLNY